METVVGWRSVRSLDKYVARMIDDTRLFCAILMVIIHRRLLL
jgi:hypothetical protein